MLLSAAIVTTLALMPQISAYERAQAAFERRDFKVAIEQLSVAVKKDPKNPDVRLLLARALIEAGRAGEAIPHIETAAADRSNPEARFQAGQILQQLARDRYADLRRIAPESTEVDELAGRQMELQGRFADALKYYRAAAAKDAQRSGVHFLIGNVLWRQRDLPGAEAELRLELQRNPFHGMANLRLGEVLLATDRSGDAVSVLERARAALPESAYARRELGKAYRKAGRPQDALAQWQAVAQASPGDEQVHFLLGTLYKELGRVHESGRELKLHREILARRRSSAEKK